MIGHRKQFYAVRWGEVIRVSSKVFDPGAACRDTFGMVAENMEVRPLGGNKETMLKEMRTPANLTFGLVPEDYLDKLGRSIRQHRDQGESK